MAMGASERQSRKTVKWRDFIHSDPEILVGKPVVRGTRLSVDFILRLLGNGWTVQEVLENYPRLTAEAVQAVFAYAGECLSEGALQVIPPPPPPKPASWLGCMESTVDIKNDIVGPILIENERQVLKS
jgi:uncharacterized protein (DUF433 family)